MTTEDILALVPDYQGFYTVEEMDAKVRALCEAYPETIRGAVIGHSRKEFPIRSMTIGSGPKNALCFACPHPNEPIGMMTLLTLAEILGSHPAYTEETGFTWTLIPCVDPDGTRLNEGWFKGPFSILNYARDFYRPPGEAQVEWTFPIELPGYRFDQPLPETTALTALIDRLKPDFMFSLHNSAFGGAYWYVERADEALCRALQGAAARQGIPLHLGEPEASYVPKWADAVFGSLTLTDMIEDIRARGGELPASGSCGGTSADYLRRVSGGQMMLAELPYFFDARIGDQSESGMSRGDALREGVRISRENYGILERYWDRVHPLFSPENPFFAFVDLCIAYHEADMEGKLALAASPEGERPALVSEVFDDLYCLRLPECLNLGLAARSCRYELARPERKSAAELACLKECEKSFDRELERLCAWLEENTDVEVISIRRLVSVQLESALVVTRALR